MSRHFIPQHCQTTRKTGIVLTIIASLLLCFSLPGRADITTMKQVQSFIDSMAKEHNFDRQELVKLFKQVNINKKIIEAIKRPAESKPWYQYRPIFLTQKRIHEGVKFWEKHADALKRARKTYGVPEQIVVAIIGVESFYGRHKGRYRVMDSLSSLGFAYPKRSKFFLSELEEFLLLAREEKVNPLAYKGSYAGAMGKPQFIASSYRNYAVDFDNDGKRDLLDNTTDVIGSVANYFSRHHWQRDEPITTPAQTTGNSFKQILKNGTKPKAPLSKLLQNGISVYNEFPLSQASALIELETRGGQEYWVGFDNFYVITRYNHSELYAMAVYQLGQAILEQRRVKLADAQKTAH
jgi:membrane-bound lytic murein transglycosylase B